MNSYFKSIFAIGIVLPMILTAIVVIGCVMTFNHYHKKLLRQTRIYAAINLCKQQLQGAEQEARFLDAEISSFKSIRQFDDLISMLKTATGSEKGSNWILSDSPSSAQRAFTIEGLSGPTVPIIGEALKKSPTVLIESWNIQKNAKKKRLIFHVKTILPITEQSE